MALFYLKLRTSSTQDPAHTLLNEYIGMIASHRAHPLLFGARRGTEPVSDENWEDFFSVEIGLKAAAGMYLGVGKRERIEEATLMSSR